MVSVIRGRPSPSKPPTLLIYRCTETGRLVSAWVHRAYSRLATCQGSFACCHGQGECQSLDFLIAIPILASRSFRLRIVVQCYHHISYTGDDNTASTIKTKAKAKTERIKLIMQT